MRTNTADDVRTIPTLSDNGHRVSQELCPDDRVATPETAGVRERGGRSGYGVSGAALTKESGLEDDLEAIGAAD